MDLVTVIVPVYNVENYLCRCIESIINQTYQNLEILLIDDGSIDKSGDICDDYQLIDSRIKVIHKKNEGLSAARNLGIEKAVGEYLIFVDSDDWINFEMIENLYTAITKYKADISCMKLLKVWNENEDLQINQNSGEFYLYSGEEAVVKYFSNEDYRTSGIVTPVWNKLYRKKLFEDIIFPVNKLFEDEYVTYKLLYQSRCVVDIDKVGYFYLQRVGSIMNSGLNEKKLLSYNAKREMYQYFQKENVDLKQLIAPLYIDDYFNKYLEIIKGHIYIDVKLKQHYINFLLKDIREDFRGLLKCKMSFKKKILLVCFSISPKIYHHTINLINFNKMILRRGSA